MRPVLRPGLRRQQIDGQVYLTDAQTTVTVCEPGILLLDAVDGVRTADEILDAVLAASGPAERTDTDAAEVETAWRWLLSRGLLVDADAHLHHLAEVPDVFTLPDPGDHHPLLELMAGPDGERRWRARRSCAMQVRGHGATATAVAGMLSGSGVPLVETGAPQTPDLVVLAHDHEPPADELEALVRDDVAHLIGGLRDREGQIGPLVVPGWTACARCFDLYRAAADPSWRWRRALLSAPVTHPVGPSVASYPVLVSTVTTLVAEALAFIEGRTPVSCEGTLRLRDHDPRPTFETLEPHPWCGCVWPSDNLGGSATMGA